MKFFDNINDYNDYFCVELSCRGYLYARPIYIHQYWKGAGYYWLDSRNKISYSVVDTRLENVPFSTVQKCDVSRRFTIDDMRKAYDAAVFNPNNQKFDEWIKQAYNVC